MSEEISNLNLTKENIVLKEKLVKIEEENAELKGQNAELKEQITKLMDKIGAMNSEKLKSPHENPTELSSAISKLQTMKRSHKEEESSDFCPEANKKPKFTETKTKFVPNWLIEVLEWIDRIEMANSSLSFSSSTFKQLCWPKLHLNVELYEIHYLECSQTHNYDHRAFLRLGDYEEIFSIALIPPPRYITFKEFKLNIYDINTEMVNFVKKCAHLIQKCNLELNFNINEISPDMDKKRFELMQNLLECLANKIEEIELYMNLAEFNRLFPGTIDQVKFIDYNGNSSMLLDNDFLMNWLNKQSNQRKQKIIHIQFDPKTTILLILIKRIKKEFLNANFPSIFTICFWTYRKIARNANANQQLTLENARTNEILTIYLKISNYGKYSIYMARYPKGEEQWKQRGEKTY